MVGLYNEPFVPHSEDELVVLYCKPLRSRPTSISQVEVLENREREPDVSETSSDILASYEEAVT